MVHGPRPIGVLRVLALLGLTLLVLGTFGDGRALAICNTSGGRLPLPPPVLDDQPPVLEDEPETKKPPPDEAPPPPDEAPPPREGGNPGAPTTPPGEPSEPTTETPQSEPTAPAPEPSAPDPRIPGNTTPAGPSTGEAPSIGGTRRKRPAAVSQSEWDWKTWWAFNRWNYLPSRNRSLERHFDRFRVTTGEQTGGLSAWERRRDELTRMRVVPALIALMRSKLSPGNEGIRASAAPALARSANDVLAVEAVLSAAESTSSSEEVRRAATFAAGLLRRTEPARQMPGELADGVRKRLFAIADSKEASTTVRCLALISIGVLGDQPCAGSLPQGMLQVHGLWRRLEARDHGVELHVALLTALGLEPDSSTSDEVRTALKDIVLGKRALKRSWNEKERSHALGALVRVGGAASRPMLMRLFAQKGISADVRRAAFITLADRADGFSPEDRKELVKAWDLAKKNAHDPLSDGLALIALARILAADLRDPEGGRLIQVTPAAKTLLRELRAAPQASRGFAALAVAIAARDAVGGDRSVVRFREEAEAVLLDGLRRNEGNALSQAPYAAAVGILRIESAVPTLEGIVCDSNADADLRGLAATALGQIGRAGPSTVKALKRAVADYRLGNNRLDAALGLAYLTGDRDSAFLRQDIERRRYTHSHRIGHVSIALGQMGDLKAIDPLCDLLLDTRSDHGARGAAAVALGLLVDPEDEPSLSRLWRDVNYPARTYALHVALDYQ